MKGEPNARAVNTLGQISDVHIEHLSEVPKQY